MKRLIFVTFATGIVALASLFTVGQTQTLPAPTVDRVGFPTGYQDTYEVLYVFDNYQNRQIRKVYANAIAASVTHRDAFDFPYGSILLFESYTVQQDSNGEPVLDENGRFIPANLTTIFVMRKEMGFGEDYQELRNGEWEYVAYRPDGSYANAPSTTGSCALCHLTGAGLPLSADSKPTGAQWDYVFRSDLYFGQGTGAIPKGTLQHYLFVPSTIHAQPGETITVYNNDQLLHRIVADDGSLDTGVMIPGSSFTVKAGEAGTVVNYRCTLHSRMRGQIVVDSPPAVPSVAGLTINPRAVQVSGSYDALIAGTDLSDQTYFDVLLRAPGGTVDEEVLNWQRGISGSHTIPVGTAAGTWMVTGVRAHKDAADHGGRYIPVTAKLRVARY